jgi:hypothetical protein
MKSNSFPTVPKTVFQAFRFPELGFDIHIVPHSARSAAAIRQQARTKNLSLAEYLHEELSDGLVLGELDQPCAATVNFGR